MSAKETDLDAELAIAREKIEELSGELEHTKFTVRKFQDHADRQSKALCDLREAVLTKQAAEQTLWRRMLDAQEVANTEVYVAQYEWPPF